MADVSATERRPPIVGGMARRSKLLVVRLYFALYYQHGLSSPTYSIIIMLTLQDLLSTNWLTRGMEAFEVWDWIQGMGLAKVKDLPEGHKCKLTLPNWDHWGDESKRAESCDGRRGEFR